MVLGHLPSTVTLASTNLWQSEHPDSGFHELIEIGLHWTHPLMVSQPTKKHCGTGQWIRCVEGMVTAKRDLHELKDQVQLIVFSNYLPCIAVGSGPYSSYWRFPGNTLKLRRVIPQFGWIAYIHHYLPNLIIAVLPPYLVSWTSSHIWHWQIRHLAISPLSALQCWDGWASARAAQVPRALIHSTLFQDLLSKWVPKPQSALSVHDTCVCVCACACLSF